MASLGERMVGAMQANVSTFEEIEKDLENGWLNVRMAHGDWAMVRELARMGFEHARGFGRVEQMPPIGTTPSHERQSFSDPISDGADGAVPPFDE